MPASQALSGEVLRPDEGAQVVFAPSAFRRHDVQVFALPTGYTVAEAVELALASVKMGPKLRRHLAVFLAREGEPGEHRIERANWHRVRPRPGTLIHIRVDLQGGGGGKNPLRALLMIAVAVIAIAFAPQIGWLIAQGAVGLGIPVGIANAIGATALVTAGLITAGQALVNALIPPPQVSNKFGFDQQPGNPYAALTGIRNQFAPYAPIPRIIGKRRIYPMLAARPYTEAQGKTQYLRMLLLVGYGPCEITDICIGNTPITAFAGAQYEIREGWTAATGVLKSGGAVGADAAPTLYTKQINEEALSILLSPSTDNTRTSDTGATELSLDVTFPQGLAHINSSSGKRENRTVDFTVQWRADGAGAWTDANWINGESDQGTGTDGLLRARAASASTEVRSGRFLVTGGTTYEVKVRRTTAAGTSYDVDLAYWTVLRSIIPESPVNMEGLTLIALRLKATEQLNGAPDTINCIAHSYLPVYDPGSATFSFQKSRSPSWGVLDLLRRRGTKAMIQDSRVILDDFADFAEACAETAPNAAEPYHQCDIVLEGGSVLTCAQTVAAAGRAQLALVDGRYTIVRDIEQDTPVQHITPSNSWGYRGFKAFVDIPHAFRATFINEAKNYAQDEVLVYRDGYSEDGAGSTDAADKFETLEFPTSSSATQSWRDARYHFAQLQLRPEEHSVNMDIEAIRCVKGSRVEFSHDVISVGLGSGRIVSVDLDGSGNCTGVTIDHSVSMVDGTDYGLRIRARDLTSALYQVVTEEGVDQSHVTFETPIPAADCPRSGDLFAFGELASVTAPMKVKAIAPGPNLSARIVLVDDQPGVYSADTGEIPAFNTFISRGLPLDQLQPDAPTITLRSDATAIQRTGDGSLIDRIAIFHDPPVPGDVPLANWQAEFKRSDTDEDWEAVQPGVVRVGTPLFATPVNQGEEYDIRARFISKAGYPSDWVVETNHEVIGKTAAPGPISSFTVFATLRGVKLDFDRSPDFDVVRYEVRYGGVDWASATVLDTTCPGPASLYDFALTGSVTFRIKAVDVIGLYSTEVTASTPAENARVDGAFFLGNPNLASVNAYRSPATVLSWSDAGSTATIAIAAHTLSSSQASGAARNASYNSGSVTGLSFSTVYHIWAYDPSFSGGAVTYVSSTSINTYVTDARYLWVGQFTTGADGGGGGGGGPPICVSAEAWLTETLQAKNARVGDLIDVIEGDVVFRAPIEAVHHHCTAGVRLVAESGADLDASVQAPVDQPQGPPIDAGGAEGCWIRVHDAAGLRWERVKAVHALGLIDVVTITVGDRSFLCGNRAEQRLGTHNKIWE